MTTQAHADALPPDGPGVSLVVAVYNQARFLPALLSSIAAQDCVVPYEVLICDDGSNDDTAEIVRGWKGLNIRHIWQPDLGFRVSRSRNNGIRCAQGSVLVFVDGDSILRPSFLQDHCDAHAGNARALVCGTFQSVVTAESEIPFDAVPFLASLPAAAGDDAEARRHYIASGQPWLACLTGNMSIRRDDALAFDETFEGWGSEDRDFCFRLCASGLGVVLLERANLIHVVATDRCLPWHPIKGGAGDAVAAMLEAKLHLLRKYPDGAMGPSLRLVRHCHLDRQTDTWRFGHLTPDRSAVEILGEFERWLGTRKH